MARYHTSERRYTWGAIILHWLLTALIVANFVLVWIAEDLPPEDEGRLVGFHMALGLAILALTVLRILWRLLHPAPPFAETLKAWEVALARVVHSLFYFLMVAIPLVGWMMVSAASGGQPVSFFGVFEIPGLPLAADKETAGVLHEVHELLATAMLALLALHVVGALKHLIVDRDGTMRRILVAR